MSMDAGGCDGSRQSSRSSRSISMDLCFERIRPNPLPFCHNKLDSISVFKLVLDHGCNFHISGFGLGVAKCSLG